MYITCKCGVKRNLEEAENCPICEDKRLHKEAKENPYVVPVELQTPMQKYWVKKQREWRAKNKIK